MDSLLIQPVAAGWDEVILGMTTIQRELAQVLRRRRRSYLNPPIGQMPTPASQQARLATLEDIADHIADVLAVQDETETFSRREWLRFIQTGRAA